MSRIFLGVLNKPAASVCRASSETITTAGELKWIGIILPFICLASSIVTVPDTALRSPAHSLRSEICDGYHRDVFTRVRSASKT